MDCIPIKLREFPKRKMKVKKTEYCLWRRDIFAPVTIIQELKNSSWYFGQNAGEVPEFPKKFSFPQWKYPKSQLCFRLKVTPVTTCVWLSQYETALCWSRSDWSTTWPSVTTPSNWETRCTKHSWWGRKSLQSHTLTYFLSCSVRHTKHVRKRENIHMCMHTHIKSILFFSRFNFFFSFLFFWILCFTI